MKSESIMKNHYDIKKEQGNDYINHYPVMCLGCYNDMTQSNASG